MPDEHSSSITPVLQLGAMITTHPIAANTWSQHAAPTNIFLKCYEALVDLQISAAASGDQSKRDVVIVITLGGIQASLSTPETHSVPNVDAVNLLSTNTKPSWMVGLPDRPGGADWAALQWLYKHLPELLLDPAIVGAARVDAKKHWQMTYKMPLAYVSAPSAAGADGGAPASGSKKPDGTGSWNFFLPLLTNHASLFSKDTLETMSGGGEVKSIEFSLFGEGVRLELARDETDQLEPNSHRVTQLAVDFPQYGGKFRWAPLQGQMVQPTKTPGHQYVVSAAAPWYYAPPTDSAYVWHSVLMNTLWALRTPARRARIRKIAQDNVQIIKKQLATTSAGPASQTLVTMRVGDWGDLLKDLTFEHGATFAALNAANSGVLAGGYFSPAQEQNLFRRTDAHFAFRNDDTSVFYHKPPSQQSALLLSGGERGAGGHGGRERQGQGSSLGTGQNGSLYWKNSTSHATGTIVHMSPMINAVYMVSCGFYFLCVVRT